MSITNVGAIDFTIDASQEVEINEEFVVKINTIENGTYDVKIFVYSGSKTNYISQIYRDGAWKSPHYYLIGVYPSMKEFNVKIIENAENPELCVKLRVVNGTPKDVCQPISITENSNSINQENNKSEKNTNKDKKIVNDSKNEMPEKTQIAELKNAPETPIKREKIILSSEKNEIGEEITPAYRVRIGIIYTFVGLCVLLVVLMALRKL